MAEHILDRPRSTLYPPSWAVSICLTASQLAPVKAGVRILHEAAHNKLNLQLYTVRARSRNMKVLMGD